MRAGGMCNQFWTDCIINKQQNAWNHCVYESDDDEMSYGLNLHGLIPVHQCGFLNFVQFFVSKINGEIQRNNC